MAPRRRPPQQQLHDWLLLLDQGTRQDLAKAIEYFDRAIEQDPNYALAYSSLTDAYLLNAYFGYDLVPLQQAYDKAREAAAKAVHLGENLPERKSPRAWSNRISHLPQAPTIIYTKYLTLPILC